MIRRLGISASRRKSLVVALVIVAIALAIDLLHRSDDQNRIGVDFHTYLAAAQVGVQHGWSHIYDQGLVAIAQQQLVPGQRWQPFLSPPTVAWAAAPLLRLPSYDSAYLLWAVLTFAVLFAAVALSSVSRGLSRWVVAIGAMGPWFVMHAVNVGQVVPLVAAGVVVGWRLTRDKHDVAAGLVLAAILLKPNTSILVPFALLFAGRYRAFVTWIGASLLVAALVILTVGVDGMSAYISQLMGPLPSGADDLTLHGALEASGVVAIILRLLIVGAVLGTAYRLRGSPSLVIPIAIVGSLLASPYLHGSDLCLLAVAGWMVWEERPPVPLRIGLLVGWILASPFLFDLRLSPHLKQWPWLELALLLALVFAAWLPLTAWADSRRRAPA